MQYLDAINARVQEGRLTPLLGESFRQFFYTYQAALKENGLEVERAYLQLYQFLDLVCEQLQAPYFFEPYHQAIRRPFDYYRFGLEFIRPLIAFEKSTLQGQHHIDLMLKQLEKGENVILLANHQGEPDPQVISLMLEKNYTHFAEKMIFVAGHRVISDPMAVPFSKGRNLLCIFSKKYMAMPEEEKEAKLLHNKRTLKRMEQLLAEGGKCIYVAPSGGRDRPNATGEIEVAPFDAQSIELFSLLAQKSGVKTHFYTLALSTYHVLPPPQKINSELGERRIAQCAPVHVCFGAEVDMAGLSFLPEVDRQQRKVLRAEWLWQKVKKDYQAFTKC